MKRGVRSSAAVGFLATGISLVAVELGYRVLLEARYRRAVSAFSSETWRLEPRGPLIFRLPAAHEGRVKMAAAEEYVPYRTNADGFRDASRGAKRDGVPRVLVLGDSYTFGWGVTDTEPFPQVTETLLREPRGGGLRKSSTPASPATTRSRRRPCSRSCCPAIAPTWSSSAT